MSSVSSAFTQTVAQIRNTSSNKTDAVRKHLKAFGSITSMQAFHLYNATRLSRIIFDIRRSNVMEVTSMPIEILDRYGNKTTFCKYIYHREVSDINQES